MKTVGSREGVIRTAAAAKVLEGGGGGGGRSRVPWAVKNFFLQLSLDRLIPRLPSTLSSHFHFCIRSSPPELLGGDFFNECSRLKGEEKRRESTGEREEFRGKRAKKADERSVRLRE